MVAMAAVVAEVVISLMRIGMAEEPARDISLTVRGRQRTIQQC
jgi:hypothetical protein